NDQVRFKPKPVEGTQATAQEAEPELLLLDGQQRLTSLTQALTGDGVVETKDARDQLVRRRYFVDMRIALEGEERIDDAVVSMPGDVVERSNFGREVVRDLSTPERQRDAACFPVNL